MTAEPNRPPAPVGQQVPPTHAAARHEGALRTARGALPSTTGTASPRSRKDTPKLDGNREH